MRYQLVLRFLIATICLPIGAISCRFATDSESTSDLAGIVAQTQTAMAIEQILTPKIPTSTQVVPLTNLTTMASQLPLTETKPSQPTITPSMVSTPLTTSPVPQQSCTDLAKFESETIPDDTVFSPGQEFLKTWTLRNVGTCTWSPEYSLIFIQGDQMGGTSPAPIGQSVPPNGTLRLYLPQKAPQNPGVYQGFWKIRSTGGKEFGLGNNGEVAFWVKIQVASGAGVVSGGPQNLGSPDWVESFEGKRSPWYLGANSDISFTIENGKLVMTAFKPIGDQWRVAVPGFLSDFYLQANYTNGLTCAGKDGFGLLVRAPDQPDNIIDSGYVFSFSCDGNYRIYRMDNGNFDGIVNWTSSPSIKIGPNQSNVIGVWAKGKKIQLYANGTLLYELDDQTYSAGLFGLAIRSERTNDLRIFVDEVAYWILK